MKQECNSTFMVADCCRKKQKIKS